MARPCALPEQQEGAPATSTCKGSLRIRGHPYAARLWSPGRIRRFSPVCRAGVWAGFQQLSGYAPFQISGSQVALVRLGYRVRVSDLALTRGLFVGGSVELGNAWDRPQDIWRGAKRKGFSLCIFGADTAFGRSTPQW